MPSGFGYVVRGVRELRADLDRIDLQVDAATLAALKAMQADAKKNIRARMRGRARWDHRGASQRTGPSVDLHLSPHHVTKSSGPGRLTGTLSRGVGGVRRPKKVGSTFTGGVGVGGQVQNLYKREVEAKFPFIAPGVARTITNGREIWAKAWAKAIKK